MNQIAEVSPFVASNKTLSIGGIAAQLNHLKGDVLTIIDASIPDDRRCKAVKDLTHKAFQDRINYIERDLCNVGGNPENTRNKV